VDLQATAPEFTSVLVVRWLCDNRRYALLKRVRARHQAEQNAFKVINTLRAMGHIVPTPEPLFSDIERKGVAQLIVALNIFEILSPLCFVAGSVWGLIEIGTAH
jgi:hypothetical protein